MIKAVVLDFGGVVFIDKLEFDGPKGNLSNDPKLWAEARVGKADDEAVFDDIAKRFGETVEQVKLWFFSRREPNQELLLLLTKLKPNIKVGVLNNGLRTLFYGFLDKYELRNHFDVLINSAEEGVEKPDARIYLAMCQQLNVNPHECLFIDDNDSNLKGAEAVGMLAIKMTNTKSLEQKFDELKLFSQDSDSGRS